jgi:hypothetical protein
MEELLERGPPLPIRRVGEGEGVCNEEEREWGSTARIESHDCRGPPTVACARPPPLIRIIRLPQPSRRGIARQDRRIIPIWRRTDDHARPDGTLHPRHSSRPRQAQPRRSSDHTRSAANQNCLPLPRPRRSSRLRQAQRRRSSDHTRSAANEPCWPRRLSAARSARAIRRRCVPGRYLSRYLRL